MNSPRPVSSIVRRGFRVGKDMQIDETVSIVGYDPEWPNLFEKERAILIKALGDRIGDLQHVGSTAVGGLASKPVIDILAGLHSYPANSQLIEELERLGYEYLGEAGVLERQYLRKRSVESYNLHLVEEGSDHWEKNVLLRDYLRANSEEAMRYARHKEELMKKGVKTLLEYSYQKAKMMAEMIERAIKWRRKVTGMALPVTIDWDQLIKRMRENLNSYWGGWTRRPGCLGEMLFDLGIQWSVPGVLRQFYSFRENAITTKTKAGEYALTCVPTRWHQLIREAINIREGKKTSTYRYRIVRTKASTYQHRIVRTIEAVRFLKFIIQTCNASFT
jgi:GrpB-like predicted nucleotidyltransferase (UPF0157 family)